MSRLPPTIRGTPEPREPPLRGHPRADGDSALADGGDAALRKVNVPTPRARRPVARGWQHRHRHPIITPTDTVSATHPGFRQLTPNLGH